MKYAPDPPLGINEHICVSKLYVNTHTQPSKRSLPPSLLFRISTRIRFLLDVEPAKHLHPERKDLPPDSVLYGFLTQLYPACYPLED
jgi:hypothetical protein